MARTRGRGLGRVNKLTFQVKMVDSPVRVMWVLGDLPHLENSIASSFTLVRCQITSLYHNICQYHFFCTYLLFTLLVHWEISDWTLLSVFNKVTDLISMLFRLSSTRVECSFKTSLPEVGPPTADLVFIGTFGVAQVESEVCCAPHVDQTLSVCGGKYVMI